MRLILFVTILVISVLLSRSSVAEEVDLELVLAVDVSQGVDDYEARLQRSGYTQALVHPTVISAIKSGPTGRIAVAYVEWAGDSHQRLVIDWMVISDTESATTFTRNLAKQLIGRAPSTSISALIDFASVQIKNNDFEGLRSVIDISGDGPNSDGRPVRAAREDAIAEGLTINGLPILTFRPNLGGSSPAVGVASRYVQNVIGSPGAFVIEVNEFENFAPALTEKLIREIQEGLQSAKR